MSSPTVPQDAKADTKPTTKPPATQKAAPDLSAQQVAALTEKELMKLAGVLGRLRERRKKAVQQQRAAEAALRDVQRQIRTLLQAATLDARGAGDLGAAEATPNGDGRA